MAFSAVSMVSSFEADDDTHDLVGVGERKKSFSTGRSCFIQTEKKRSDRYTVVSTHALGPVLLRRGRGRGGGLSILACDTHGFCCD